MTKSLSQKLAELEELRSRNALEEHSQPKPLIDMLDELDELVDSAISSIASERWEFVNEDDCAKALKQLSERFQNDERWEFSEPLAKKTLTDRVVGPYHILEELSSGGMGSVYRARHLDMKRDVALKTIHSWKMRNPKAKSRFQREVQALGKLNHPHIVAAFDSGEDEGISYLAMELVDGIDLSSLVKRCGTLAVSDACEIVRQAAEGLQYIHDQGLIHRDIKPSNLMLTRDGTVKILDLGLAQYRVLDEEELTRTGQMMGTLDYMAPEQALDAGNVDPRADIYSLGVTLFKLLTGATPFSREKYSNPLQKTRAMLGEPIPLVSEYRYDLSSDLVALTGQCLASDPTDRIASSAELVEAISKHATGHRIPELARVSVIGDPDTALETVDATLSGTRPTRWILPVFIAVALLCFGLIVANNQLDNYGSSSLVSSRSQSENELSSTSLGESIESVPIPGYWTIAPLEGTNSVQPAGFCEATMTLIGSSVNTVSRTSRGMTWTPDQGSSPVAVEENYRVTRCLGISRDGTLIAGDALGGDVIWSQETGWIPIKTSRKLEPYVLTSESKLLLGIATFPSKQRSRSLGFYRLDSDLSAFQMEFLPCEKLNLDDRSLSIIGASDSLDYIIGSRRPYRGNDLIEYWARNEAGELNHVPKPFREGVLSGITQNGRFLFGSDAERHPVLYDRLNAQLVVLSQTHEGVCTGCSEDGIRAAGESLSGQGGWIYSSDTDEIAFLIDLVEEAGVPRKQLTGKFGAVRGMTSSGNYIWGVARDSSTESVNGWLLDLSASEIDPVDTSTQ